jgi:hypothetical protein
MARRILAIDSGVVNGNAGIPLWDAGGAEGAAATSLATSYVMTAEAKNGPMLW